MNRTIDSSFGFGRNAGRHERAEPFGVCPKLIEVALPIREISAESVRDRNIRHAHISHLHIWWARRPPVASCAAVSASLVSGPDDPACPGDFRAAVERHLWTHVPANLKYYRRRVTHHDVDPYRPYDGIEDTPRNRLLTLVAKCVCARYM